MARTNRVTAAVLGAAAVVLGIFTAPSSGAADEDNCTVSVDWEDPTVTCFATFTEAVRVATGGSITDAPATVAEAVRDDALMRRMGVNLEKTATLPVLIPAATCR
ncbi:hypothetical protein ALI144C_19035 [Actinosynnema sp. ALI-1.44]|uniref:hypothetical protein n=1 Tax=Actinosynnema sp. ALI-1.44 TaxID=1933779 RepID=UPI00097C21C7|nr:hypothetical protein [Actinosynnema sp. ALI-1.44]ONI81432.1 hypothetical protein ALI144C_19035 [Actinosynnema sp. ALI-1.44]